MKPKVYACHKCQRLLGSNMYLYIQTELGPLAFCSSCVKAGYKELIQLQPKSPQIKKILADFKKFLIKFKMGVDS